MKQSKIERSILTTVLDLEISRGHLKWRVSDFARFSKVSRPLVYYHFGKTKAEILDTCLDLVAIHYYGLDDERENSLLDGQLIDSLKLTRSLFLKNPSLVVFYQKWRAQASPLQKKLILIEKRYQKKLKTAYPFMTDDQIIVLHAMFHGVVTSPFLTEQSLTEACRMITLWTESLRAVRL